MKTRIRNAQVVLPTEVMTTNVLVDDGQIVAIGDVGVTGVDEEVDATGLMLLPGCVDDQVHFRDPGITYKEDLFTASRACAKGGITSFLEMPNTRPSVTTQARLAQKLALASKKSIVNYGFFFGATAHNIVELAAAVRTPGIKIFIGSSTGDLLVDEQEALEEIFGRTSLPICAHCEDEATLQANAERIGATRDITNHSRIRNEDVALIATKRALDLAFRHRHRFHVLHVSTGVETLLFEDHRELITAEVCPHHLFFNTDDYARLGSRVQMNPSIKPSPNPAQLWEALRSGRIQVVATDHAPHTLEEKARPYPASPSGVPAVENALALMLNRVNQGACSISEVVHWMSDAPARVWDLVGKGRIEVGYDADLVLVDMNKAQTVRDEEQVTKCRWSPWHGETLTGWPVRTWVGGRTVFVDGHVMDGERGTELQYDHQRGGYWGTGGASLRSPS